VREITPENAADYLRETGRIAPGRAVDVNALGWGVSNVVMRVDPEGGPPFVIKQARERLRTQAHWVSRLERVWTEREAMEVLAGVLPEGVVPRVLFADEPNYLFAMTCAPDGSVVWKEELLAGRLDPAVARRLGEILGTVHAATRGHPALGGRLADTTVFDELRVDPFYRTVARVHPDLAPRLDALIASMADPPGRCLVLGDFSPKNVLVHPRALTLVDFETAHAGDPAFDLGFFLSHLDLKALRAGAGKAGRYRRLFAAFAEGYRAADPVTELITAGGEAGPRVVPHRAACALARVDGKSPVDYLDAPGREAARRSALAALRRAPAP
jgi:5-methylthioribose kinase